MKKYIHIVLGRACSGKDTFAKKLISTDEQYHIDIGNIVRDITATEDRTHNASLDMKIINRLRLIVMNLPNPYDGIVITGIRQVSIFNWLLQTFGVSSCQVYWLNVPLHILKRRWEERASSKDSKMTFEEVIAKDNELGLVDLERLAMNTPAIKHIAFYED